MLLRLPQAKSGELVKSHPRHGRDLRHTTSKLSTWSELFLELSRLVQVRQQRCGPQAVGNPGISVAGIMPPADGPRLFGAPTQNTQTNFPHPVTEAVAGCPNSCGDKDKWHIYLLKKSFYVYIYIHLCIYIYIYTHVYIYYHVCKYIYIYICICIDIFLMCIYLEVGMYIHLFFLM
jgi:hypothetical protein